MQLSKENGSTTLTELKKKISQIYSQTQKKMGNEKSRGNQCHKNP